MLIVEWYLVLTFDEEEAEMAFDVGKGLLEFAVRLLSLDSELKKASLEQRIRLAEYFDGIAKCLINIYQGFTGEGEAYEACGELNGYVIVFSKVCSGILSESDIKELRDLLSRRVNARSFIEHSWDEGETKEQLRLMLDSAGKLKAIAMSLRV